MMMGAGGKRTPSFRQLHQPIKMLLIKKANKIDGVKINWSTPISQTCSISHSWSLLPEKPKKGPANPMMAAMEMDKKESGYSLNAQYAFVSEKNPADAKFVLFGNMESSGRFQSAFMWNIAKWVHFRMNYMFPNSDMCMAQRSMEVDIDTHNAAHNFTMDQQVMSYNLVKSIGRNTELGFEFFYVPERRLCDLNYAGKYTYGNHNFHGEYSSAMRSYGLSYMLR